MGKVLIGWTVFALAVFFCLSCVVMLIVNNLFSEQALTAVFGTPTIGYWKALLLTFFLGLPFRILKSFSKK